ncbi:MAG: hypothetical protein ACM37W_03555 [Actinomycetota bacterium]
MLSQQLVGIVTEGSSFGFRLLDVMACYPVVNEVAELIELGAVGEIAG